MIPRILKGNDFQLTINVNNKSEDSAFNIADAETITIYIIGANKQKYEFTDYTIKDNIISGTCTYILTPQYYNVEILLYKDKVHYRSYQVGQFLVVSNNSQAGLSSNIEFDADKVVNVYCEFGSGTDVTKSYVDSELATKLNITDYKASDVTKSYVDSQLSGKQDKGNYLTAVPDEYITETELSAKGYAINEDLKNANSSISDISTRINGKQDKGNYLTSIPSEYITESELNSKGYLTEHQSLTNYTTVNDLNTANSSISDISTRLSTIHGDVKQSYVDDISTRLSADIINLSSTNSSISDISTRLLTKLDKSSYVAPDVTKSYVDTQLSTKQDKGNYLTSVPDEYITETELSEKGYLTEHQSLTNYTTVNDLNTANSSISDISTRLLTKLDKSSYVAPTVDKTYVDSELEKKQDKGNYLTSIPDEYITESELNSKGYLTEHQSLTNYATVSDLTSANSSISDISTRINEKQDKGNYLTSIPSEYITETELNSKGYLTEHQSLTNYATVNDLNTANSSISDISTRLQTKLDKSSYVTPDVTKSYVDTQLSGKQDKGNYLTEIPDEYITETELTAKGYLTEHQSLSGLATVDSLNNANSSIGDISTRLSQVSGGGVTQSYVDDISTRLRTDINNLSVSNTSISDISTRIKNIISTGTAIIEGDIKNNTANGSHAHAEGESNTADGYRSHAEGMNNVASSNCSHAEGMFNTATGVCAHAEGSHTATNNGSEHASGQYNKSSTSSTTFGNSGNTLFSIGFGTSDTDRKNAFEIRQDGSIYTTGITEPIQIYVKDISTRLKSQYSFDSATGVLNITTV